MKNNKKKQIVKLKKQIKMLQNDISELREELIFVQWLNIYYNQNDMSLCTIILRDIHSKERELNILQIII